MDNQYEHLATGSRIPAIIDAWRDNPMINMAIEAQKYNMHLVYPMLVIFDNKANSYEELVTHIRNEYSTINPTLTIPNTIFFIFLPVNNSREIKTQVLQWINQKQPLMQ